LVASVANKARDSEDRPPSRVLLLLLLQLLFLPRSLHQLLLVLCILNLLHVNVLSQCLAQLLLLFADALELGDLLVMGRVLVCDLVLELFLEGVALGDKLAELARQVVLVHLDPLLWLTSRTLWQPRLEVLH